MEENRQCLMFDKWSTGKEQDQENTALIRQSLRDFTVLEINKILKEGSSFQVSMKIRRLANFVRRGSWWVSTSFIGIIYEKENSHSQSLIIGEL